MWSLASRIHKLNHFPSQDMDCYVKRDDELGCGISGTKMRKYASLMPFLMTQKIRHLIIIAGTQSNNLLAALQMAREFQLDVTVFLLKPRSSAIQGNFKLSRLFISDKEIIWVDREQWPSVNILAQNHLNNMNESGFVLQEGASVPVAMEGAMSLADDIVKNEQSIGFHFNHIFIDAGTGFSAAALIKGLSQMDHSALIHVLLLADEEAIFNQKLHQWSGLTPDNYCCFYPHTARSFGSINQAIKDEIRRLAREEGILADPIYSAKLFLEARRRLECEDIRGKVLIIHSGGALTMAGFDL